MMTHPTERQEKVSRSGLQMTTARSSRGKEVKVVLVDTQYVVTDATSFKSVVQSLTGNDSCVEWIKESGFTGVKRERPVNGNGSGGVGNNGASRSHGIAGVAVIDNGDSRLSDDLSFEDSDRMIFDLPPMESWHELWAENNLL